MVMRVATFSMNERMLSASLRTQAKMAEMQMQQASGLVSTDYRGISDSARSLINLEISHQRSKTYYNSADEANNRVETMITSMDTGLGVLKNFLQSIVAMRSTDRTPTTSQNLINDAKANLEQFANALNQTYGGRYLFGGSITTSAPVDLNDPAFLATDPHGGATTGYFKGDDFIAQTQVSTDHTVSYGVTANDPAFEEALRAIRMIASASADKLDDATLEAAYVLATKALDDVTVVSSKLAVTSGVLKDAMASQDQYQFSVEVNITNIKSVDAAKLAVQLATYQTQLTASFAALAKIQSISLTDYLR